jgi:hypothetical protein
VAQQLWRVEGSSAAPNLTAWQQGLTLHLLFQPVTALIVRRGGTTRHYLALEGCAHCRADGCARTCPRMLFAQLVRTTMPGVGLTPVPRLAVRPSERRQVAAMPHSAEARLLDAAFLAQWDEGRLVTTWSRLRAKSRPISVGALLTVGDAGPEPSRALHAAGWRASIIHSLASRRARGPEVQALVPFGRRTGEALYAALRDPAALLGDAAAVPLEAAHA